MRAPRETYLCAHAFFKGHNVLAALLALVRRRLDLRQQVIGHELLTDAQVLDVGVDVTGMRVPVLGALRFMVGQGPLMRVKIS